MLTRSQYSYYYDMEEPTMMDLLVSSLGIQHPASLSASYLFAIQSLPHQV